MQFQMPLCHASSVTAVLLKENAQCAHSVSQGRQVGSALIGSFTLHYARQLRGTVMLHGTSQVVLNGEGSGKSVRAVVLVMLAVSQ